MSNRINLRDWRSRAASGELEYRGQPRSLSGAVGRADESGAWPGASLFQNPADVEFGDGFPRDVAGNKRGVDARLPAIAKASSGNNLNVSAIAVVCYTTVFGFGPDDPHECQGMRLKHKCMQSHISNYRMSDSTFGLFPKRTSR